MAKYVAFAVSASIDPHTGGKVEATFYRKGINPVFGIEDDWYQTHTNLTRASCQRLWRLVDNGAVVIAPDRISVVKDVVNGRPVPTPGDGAESEWFPISEPPPEDRRLEGFLVVVEDEDGNRRVRPAGTYHKRYGFMPAVGFHNDDLVLWNYLPPAPPKVQWGEG